MQRFVWLSVGAAVLVAAWFFVARGETFAAGDVESQAPEAGGSGVDVSARSADVAPRLTRVHVDAVRGASDAPDATSDTGEGDAAPFEAAPYNDVFGRTRADPTPITVADLAAAPELNSAGAEFDAELSARLTDDLEQLRVTHARFRTEIEAVEKAEFDAAADSGYTARSEVAMAELPSGNVGVEVSMGVAGEETEVRFEDGVAKVVRVPSRLMRATNALRAGWLGEWLEFWHRVLPRLERAGHLESVDSDRIYERLHADFEGILAGYDVSFEELKKRREKR